jgi:hypothetical protein
MFMMFFFEITKEILKSYIITCLDFWKRDSDKRKYHLAK